MVIANNEKGNRIILDLISDRNATIEQQNLQDYWSVQYPYNQAKPLFFDQMFAELKEADTSFPAWRRKYCASYDFSENISRGKGCCEKVVRQSEAIN